MANDSLPRILYLTKVLPYPPAVAGDAVYSRGIIEAWSRFADLTVLCAESGADLDARHRGATWVVTVPQRSGRARSVPSCLPLISWKGATRDYQAQLTRLLRRPDWDVIVLDNIGLAHALPRAEKYRAKHPGTRLMYVSHECEYSTRACKYAAYKLNVIKETVAKLDLRKVRRWENALILGSDVVTLINPSDLAPFQNIDPSRKYLPVLPGYNGPLSPGREVTDAIPRRVLLLGGRRSAQKQQVLLEWLAAGYEALVSANIEVVVVGDIDDDLKARVSRDYPKVEVLGFVPDLTALIAQARAGLIVDTVGSGFKIRLLSHVFQRLPIVGLSSAIDGLPTPEGQGYLAAPTLEALVDLVCQVIDQPERLNAAQVRAFDDCEKEFSWNQRAKTLAAALGSAAEEVLL